jgi:hypothetical protein
MALSDQLEPEAVELSDPRDQLCHLASIAISLKRIADVLSDVCGPDAVNEYGETPFKAIGAGIARALANR